MVVFSVASMPWNDAASDVTVAISAVRKLACRVESRFPRIIEIDANTNVSAANAKVSVCNKVLEPVCFLWMAIAAVIGAFPKF